MSSAEAHLRLSIASQTTKSMRYRAKLDGENKAVRYDFDSDDPSFYLVINSEGQRTFESSIKTASNKNASKKNKLQYRFIQFSNDPMYDQLRLSSDRNQISDIAIKLEAANIKIPLDVFFSVYISDDEPPTHLTNLGVAYAIEMSDLIVIGMNYDRIMALTEDELVEVMDHHLFHVDQIRDGDLIIEGNYIQWKWWNYSYVVADIVARIRAGDEDAFDEYMRLPWEVENNNYRWW